MKRVRLRKRFKFLYSHRHPRALIERFDLEAPIPGPPKKAKPIIGTETLLHRLSWLEGARESVKAQEQDLNYFLSKRPRLKAEYECFLAAGGGSEADLKAWLYRAAQYAADPIIKRKHLALVVSNEPLRQNPAPHSTGGEAA